MKYQCLSAISPCDYFKENQTACRSCRKSYDDYEKNAGEKAIKNAIRLLESRGYTVIKRIR